MNIAIKLLSIIGLLFSIILSPLYCMADVYSNLSAGFYVPSNKLSTETGMILEADVGIRQLAGFAAEVGLSLALSDADKIDSIICFDATIKHELKVKGGGLIIGAGIGYYSFTYGDNSTLALTEKGIGPHLLLEVRDDNVNIAIKKSFLNWKYDDSSTIDYGGFSLLVGYEF